MVELHTPQLNQIFHALGDATRRRMIHDLADGERTVSQLAEPFAMSLAAASKHIKVLERAGLVVRGREAQYRPCALDAGPLEEVSSWAEQYRPIWESRFDRMDDYLTQLRTQSRGDNE